MKKFKYYSTMRPLGPGSCPADGIVKVKNFDNPKWIPEINHMAYAAIEYDHMLSDAEKKQYDLVIDQDDDLFEIDGLWYYWMHIEAMMDGELREALHNYLAPCTNKKFFDIYCKIWNKEYPDAPFEEAVKELCYGQELEDYD